LAKSNLILSSEALVSQVIALVQSARQAVVRDTNSVMIFSYFQVGKPIVEQEQGGSTKAAYDKGALSELSKKLTEAFGKGFSADNLPNMLRFYLCFSISETVSRILSSRRKLFAYQYTLHLPTKAKLKK
jgi:hypothetical protein